MGAAFLVAGLTRSSGAVVVDTSLPLRDVDATINAGLIGMKVGLRWTPTALGSLTDDWLCGPYANCEVVDVNRSWFRQLEFAVGGFLCF